jgi:hypothetical protein
MRPGTSTFVSFSRLRSVGSGHVCIASLTLCLALFVPLYVRAQAVADATVLRVQILNGKTGRPITNQHLRLLRKDGKAIDNKGETTDGEGYAAIPNTDASLPDVFISVDLHVPCSKTGKHDFSLAKVRVSGVVSENSCRPRISMYPQAGTLIFYVRDQTFLEKMRH